MLVSEVEEKAHEEAVSAVIRREWLGGDTYLCLSDIVYMCEVSRERFIIEGNPGASEAMSRLAHIFQMVAIVA